MQADLLQLFQHGVGTAHGFVLRVKVKSEIAPVQQRLRRLPFAVRDKVKQELLRLESAGIIERIDASEWIFQPLCHTRNLVTFACA